MMISIKKFGAAALLSAGCLMFTQSASAQTDEGGKNVAKWNVLGVAAKNISFQYERAIGKKISVALNLGLTPKGNLPFQGTFKNLADDEELDRQIDGLKTGSFAITPEVRFYLSKGALHGFYLAPYVRYATNTYDSDFKYDVNGDERTILIDGNTKVFTGGLMFGSQHKLGSKVYINWWLGAGAGSISGDLNGTANLSDQERDALQQELNDLDPPLLKLASQVTNSGATVNVSGTGISARLGLAIGFRF